MNIKKNVFVIMPFSSTASCTKEEWYEIYENVFYPAITECGYFCERAVPNTGSLIASIVEKLKTARIVLADITDRNPNVFYELGVRHALSKRTIVISQNTSDIPSDLRGYWSLEYGIRPAQVAQFKRDIHRLITEIEKNPDKSDSPVCDYLERENITILRYMQRENIKKLGALFTELTGNILFLENFLPIQYPQSDTSQQFTDIFLSTDCLKLLLNTMYVDIGTKLLKDAYELLRFLERIRIDNSDKHVIQHALTSLRSFSKHIVELRDRLSRGDYQEPSQISTMAWSLSLPVIYRPPFIIDQCKSVNLDPRWLCSQASLELFCREFRSWNKDGKQHIWEKKKIKQPDQLKGGENSTSG
jgi:hypothetical protein